MASSGPDDGQTPPNDGADPLRMIADKLAGGFETYARLMEQIAGAAGGTGGDGKGAEAPLKEAWLIASASTVRYGQGLTEVFGRHQGALTAAAARKIGAQKATPEELRAEAEQIRGFLREVGETAVFEARRLERELAALGESVAQQASEPWPEGADHRTWNMKR